MFRNKKVATLGIAAVGALALGTAWAHVSASSGTHHTPQAADVDNILPLATISVGASGTTTFTVPANGAGGLTVTCLHSTDVVKTPAGAGGATQNVLTLPPTFDNGIAANGIPNKCTDNLNGTTVTTTKGPWAAQIIDLPNEPTTGAGGEPNVDNVNVIVPKAGAVVKTSEGCTITVAPQAPYTVQGTMDDNTGQLTVNITSATNALPALVTGGGLCPVTPSAASCAGQTPAFCSTFHGVYQFTPKISV